jgi:hypothetical protein
MSTKKLLIPILCCLLCFINVLSAQESIPQLTYGVVKDADLKLKEWRADSSVSAFVLGDVGNISMQLVDDYYGYHFTELRRLKILKKAGFGYATIEIPYYSKDETQTIAHIRAQTIAPNGEKTPVDSSTIVYKKLNSEWSVVQFTFPKITEGCVVEYEYELHSTRSIELREWYFQDKIPTRLSVLNLDLLSRYEYIHLVQGKNNLTVTTPRKDSISERVFTTYYAKDLPGFTDEQYVSNINNYLTHIRFQLANYVGINGVKHEILTTWDRMADDLLKNDNFGQKFLKKSNYNLLLESAKNVVQRGDAQKVKIQKIYDFVNKNIHWDGNYSLITNNMPNDVWQTRNGSSTDINLTLLVLLKEAGIDAYPMLVSTQGHGKVNAEYPVFDQFNHTMILVEMVSGQPLILDAGDAARPMGMPSKQAVNEKGWLLKKIEPSWVEIKPTMSAQLMVAKFDIMPNKLMTGTVATTYRNYMSVEQRNTYDAGEATPEKGRMDYLKSKYSNCQIGEVTCLNLDKKLEPLKETIICSVSDAVTVDKNWMYIKPTLKTDWDINPFKLLNRAYPVEFSGLFTEQYVAEIAIPAGYKVEDMPKDLRLSLPLEGIVFNYQITNDGDNFIKLSILLQVNKTTFLPEEYVGLKDFFRQVAFKFGQKVSLKRIGQ